MFRHPKNGSARSFLLPLSACVLTAVALSNVSFAEQLAISTSDGLGADTYVQSYGSTAVHNDTNFGGRAVIEVTNVGSDSPPQTLHRKSWLRFDLSGLSGAQVSDASLSLACWSADSSSMTFSVWGLNDNEGGQSWIEGTGNNTNVVTDGDPSNDNWITWNNTPGNAAGNTVDASKTVSLGTFTGGGHLSQAEFTSGALCDFINADTDGLVTVIITRDNFGVYPSSPVHNFVSSEMSGQMHPTLSLTPVPEPSVLALLAGIAMVCLIGQRSNNSEKA